MQTEATHRAGARAARRRLRHVTRLQINDARDWLVRHGVELHIHQEPVRGDVGEALLSRADDLGADLVVMGGYGHSRMVDARSVGATLWRRNRRLQWPLC